MLIDVIKNFNIARGAIGMLFERTCKTENNNLSDRQKAVKKILHLEMLISTCFFTYSYRTTAVFKNLIYNLTHDNIHICVYSKRFYFARYRLPNEMIWNLK